MHARGREDHLLTGQGLAEKFQLSYVAAYKLKKRLLADLLQPRGGVFGRSLCVSEISSTPDVVLGSDEYVSALSAELLRKDRLQHRR
jgi:hypothetical protein